MIGKVLTKHSTIAKTIRRVITTTTTSDYDEIPTPKSLPFVGTTLSLLAAGSAPKLHVYIDARHKELGPIFKEKIGPVSAVFIANPTEIRSIFANEGKYPVHIKPEAWIVYNKRNGCSRGLFFMDGEEWLENRKKMNNLLLKGDFKWIEESCERVTKNFTQNWNVKVDCIPNLEAQLYRWSLEILVALLLGDAYEKNKNQIDDILKHLSSTVHLVFETTSRLSLIPATIAAKLHLPRWKRFAESVDDALTTANRLVDNLLKIPKTNGLLVKMQHENINESIMKRIVADLILAAGDTTAYSMQWILYLIAKNPNVQNDLHRQLSKNASPPLLKNIIREALRMYPVAPFLTRYLPQETTVNGYKIPKNTLVILSIYTSSRDPNYFKNPDQFNPDRWLRNGTNTTTTMQQASLPFAIGSRSCIGRRIAEIQLQTALSELVKKYEVVLKNTEEIEMILKMVAVPSKRIKLKFIPR